MGSVEDSPLSSQATRATTAFHNVAGFESGRPTLDDWLAHRAIKSQEAGSAPHLCGSVRVRTSRAFSRCRSAPFCAL